VEERHGRGDETADGARGPEGLAAPERPGPPGGPADPAAGPGPPADPGIPATGHGPPAPPGPPPPPGAPAGQLPAQAPAPRGEPARPLRHLGNAVIGLLCLVIVVDLVALWADTVQLGLLTDVRDGRRVSLEELTSSDDRVMTVGLLQTGTYIACAIAFLIWYARAYGNLERLGAQGKFRSRRWAIISWFVPFVNYVVPKRVMNVIWRASDPDLPAVATYWESRRVSPLLHWWWATWIVSTLVANILLRDSLDSGQTADELVSIATGYVVIDIIDIVPAVLAILVVRATTNRQEERRRRYESGELAGVPESPREQPAAEPVSQPG
jgi:Domain of unknown function (DUF4328)